MSFSIGKRLLLIITFLGFGQTTVLAQTDSLAIRLKALELKFDSLKNSLKTTRANMVTHSDFEGIFKNINEEDPEFVDEDRLSKRRSLDSLLRAAVEKPGQLTFTGQMMNVFHWDGRLDNSVNTAVATVDLFALSSFGKRSLIFINLQGVGGDGPSGEFPAFSNFHAGGGSLQSDDGVDRISILEAWAQYDFNHTSIIAGKIDLTNYFDPNSVANDEYSQFLSGMFVNNTALAVPSNGPGITSNTSLLGGLSLQVGIASSDNDGNRIFEDLFSIIQLGESFKLNGEEVGGIRAYAYKNNAMSNAVGYGFSGDAKLGGSLYAYGRYGQNQDGLANDFGVKRSYSGGLQLRNFSLFKNASVTAGTAIGSSEGAITEGLSLTRESIHETYVRLNVKKAFFLSLHLQSIRNALGQNGADLTVIGLRTRLAF